MKQLIIGFAALGLVCVGCSKSDPPAPTAPPATPPSAVAPPPPMDVPPPVPPVQPPPPKIVSNSFLKGYHDGYYGTWLRPVAWVVADEYRQGWSAGSYDRHHGLPHQYPKK